MVIHASSSPAPSQTMRHNSRQPQALPNGSQRNTEARNLVAPRSTAGNCDLRTNDLRNTEARSLAPPRSTAGNYDLSNCDLGNYRLRSPKQPRGNELNNDSFIDHVHHEADLRERVGHPIALGSSAAKPNRPTTTQRQSASSYAPPQTGRAQRQSPLHEQTGSHRV